MIKFLGKNKFENPQIVHVFQKNETAQSLKEIYGEGIKFFPPKKIFEGASVVVENIGKKFWVVRPTDTLEKISKTLGVSEKTLRQKNQFKKLFVGQILWF